MAKEVLEFINECVVYLKMIMLINFRPLKPAENKSFELVLSDTAHLNMPSGDKKYLVVEINHFMQ